MKEYLVAIIAGVFGIVTSIVTIHYQHYFKQLENKKPKDKNEEFWSWFWIILPCVYYVFISGYLAYCAIQEVLGSTTIYLPKGWILAILEILGMLIFSILYLLPVLVVMLRSIIEGENYIIWWGIALHVVFQLVCYAFGDLGNEKTLIVFSIVWIGLSAFALYTFYTLILIFEGEPEILTEWLISLFLLLSLTPFWNLLSNPIAQYVNPIMVHYLWRS